MRVRSARKQERPYESASRAALCLFGFEKARVVALLRFFLRSPARSRSCLALLAMLTGWSASLSPYGRHARPSRAGRARSGSALLRSTAPADLVQPLLCVRARCTEERSVAVKASRLAPSCERALLKKGSCGTGPLILDEGAARAMSSAKSFSRATQSPKDAQQGKGQRELKLTARGRGGLCASRCRATGAARAATAPGSSCVPAVHLTQCSVYIIEQALKQAEQHTQ